VKFFQPLIQRPLLSLFLVLLPGSLACNSAPLEVQPMPELPSRNPISQAPRAPLAPTAPARPEVRRPKAPTGRRQTMDEVYHESFGIESVPVIFPFSKQEDVVLSVPPGTSADHRVALMGAFLGAGFQVKDAGEFGSAFFQVDSGDNAANLSGFKRYVKQSGDSGSEANLKSHTGLLSMNFSLEDPTSLWAPDLLSNPSLHASYFLRIFKLDFEDVTERVMLNQVFDKSAVVSFRKQVGDLNASLKQYNTDLMNYDGELRKYQADFNLYVKTYEKWLRDEKREFDGRHGAYTQAWEAWRAANDTAIRAQLGDGQDRKEWNAPLKSRGVQAKGLETEQAIMLPKAINLAETADLEAQIADRREVKLPARQLNFLAELVDSKTGRVVWVANARCRARKTWSDGRLLMETIGRMATSKR
jgi:hypothetical protein